MYVRRVLSIALVLLAGCDKVFRLDDVHARADGNRPADAAVDAADAPPMPDAPDPRIVARFDFDGTFVETKSGNPATCAAGNCPAFKDAVHGMGIELDGVNDCVQFNLPTNPSKLTIAFWIKKPTDIAGSVVAKPF